MSCIFSAFGCIPVDGEQNRYPLLPLMCTSEAIVVWLYHSPRPARVHVDPNLGSQPPRTHPCSGGFLEKIVTFYLSHARNSCTSRTNTTRREPHHEQLLIAYNANSAYLRLIDHPPTQLRAPIKKIGHGSLYHFLRTPAPRVFFFFSSSVANYTMLWRWRASRPQVDNFSRTLQASSLRTHRHKKEAWTPPSPPYLYTRVCMLKLIYRIGYAAINDVVLNTALFHALRVPAPSR